jgi:hypothetical protein
MDDSEVVTGDGNAVEECPAPPAYYKCFSSRKIAPPILPNIPNATSWSAGHQYNGTISSQITNQEFASVPNEDYRIAMERYGLQKQIRTPIAKEFLSLYNFEQTLKQRFRRNHDNWVVNGV